MNTFPSMNSLKQILFSFRENCTGFLFPPICIKCKNRATGNGIAAWLCGSCMSKLQENIDARTDHTCPLCSQNLTMTACSCATVFERPYEKMFSLFDFDDTLKTIVHEFKYGGFKRLAFLMGKTYAPSIPVSFFDGMDLVTSVPLHFFRHLKRGYNQADFFAGGVIAGSGRALPLSRNVLKRIRATKTQTNLSRDNRQRNVAGAFAIAKKKQCLVRDKNVVLVDDVVTTGATTAQCALALREAGAGKVRVLSLARD
jgi:competence protein ComFC